MRHIFVINPAAGKDREKKWLTDAIEKTAKKLSTKVEIYFTKCEGDTYKFAKNLRNTAQNTAQKIRLYACGGDGTLNDIVNGVYGCDNISIGCVPCGTGNDFVKNFKNKSDFLDIEKQMSAKEEPIDLIESMGKYSVNICNLGFDADVADGMERFKRLPGVSGSMAYTISVGTTLVKKLGFHAKLVFDKAKTAEEDIMLMVVGNGICYGGGYYGTPRAKLNDGLMDVCLVRKISKFKILDLIGKYKKGLHVDAPEFKGTIEYFRCKDVEIVADKPFNICRDGEVSECKTAAIHMIEKGINFINPSELLKEEKNADESFVCKL